LGVGGLTAATAAGWNPLMRLALANEAHCVSCVGAPIEAHEHYFVFVYFSGAWDLMLSLDPRDENGDYNEGNVSTTLTQPGYKMLEDPSNDGQLYNVIRADGLQDKLGPFMGDLLGHFNKLAIVRGMSSETLTHEAGRRRFLTGKPPTGLAARGSSTATWLASKLGKEQVIPNLSMRTETYNVELPNYASGLKVNSIQDLIRVLSASGPTLSPAVNTHLSALMTHDSQCPVALRSQMLQDAAAARLKATQMVAGGLDGLFDFRQNNAFGESIRAQFGIANTNASATTSVEARTAAAAIALTEGIARVVSFQANDISLDTHYDDWLSDQGPIQERGFNAVASLIDYLSCKQYKNTGSCWLDHTTIVGFSEFGRTAMINSNNGRDHSLTNACFLAGAGVKGGTIVGESSAIGMMPTRTDLLSGVPSPGGEIVKPEHVLQGLFHLAGETGDPADMRVSPLAAIFK